jgi:hypothetical protein
MQWQAAREWWRKGWRMPAAAVLRVLGKALWLELRSPKQREGGVSLAS